MTFASDPTFDMNKGVFYQVTNIYTNIYRHSSQKNYNSYNNTTINIHLNASSKDSGSFLIKTNDRDIHINMDGFIILKS